MIGVDTNVLLRFLVDDDPQQNRAAREMLARSDADSPVFVSAVTLAETVWVLTRTLGYPVRDIAAMVQDLLASDGVVMEHGDELDLLFSRGGGSVAELADHLIAWAGLAAGCRKTLTLDRRAARHVSSMELLA